MKQTIRRETLNKGAGVAKMANLSALDGPDDDTFREALRLNSDPFAEVHIFGQPSIIGEDRKKYRKRLMQSGKLK